MQVASVWRMTAPARDNADCAARSRVEPVVWACAMAVGVAATIVGGAGGPGPYLVLDIAAGAVSVGLVPLLARWPVPATVLLSLLAAVSPAATPPATMGALLVARWQRLTVALSVAGTGIVAQLIRGWWRPWPGLLYEWWAILVIVAYAAIVGWGTQIRVNRALISSLRERAEYAETEQARRVAEARAGERARIAREMHDVLAHRLSLLATYAGALSYRPDAPPEQLSRAAEVVRSGIHQALDELREVIGVLRHDDSLPDLAAGSQPLPGSADLPALIEESRAAGMLVRVSGGAWPAPGVPDAVGRTLYRVVQEGLTNARKHAAGEPVSVTLDGAPGAGLDVTVVNRLGSASARPGAAGPLPGAGTGLIGLAERVELAGGRLEHQRRESGFRLHAWLPWPDAAPGVPESGVPEPGVREPGVPEAGVREPDVPEAGVTGPAVTVPAVTGLDVTRLDVSGPGVAGAR